MIRRTSHELVFPKGGDNYNSVLIGELHARSPQAKRRNVETRGSSSGGHLVHECFVARRRAGIESR
jgi:hypothetical protein